jgi:hypothetical protein
MKKCKQCNAGFEITDEDRRFYREMGVPEPDICPVDRSRQRLAFRNMRNLHRRKCDATGKVIFAHFDDNVPFPVYEREYWWSDKWDGIDYGRDFDFSRPFFEQFEELYNVAPALNQSAFSNENCDYCNGLANCKNCYLSFNLDYCENCYHLTDGRHCINCVDVLSLAKCELCYECVYCSNSYKLFYSDRSISCHESFFLSECRQCKNCIGCCNLNQKENYLFNEKVTPEKIQEVKKELSDHKKLSEFREKFEDFKIQFPKKYYYGHVNESSTGDNLRNTKNSKNCFYCDDIENCNYCYFVFSSNNCQDLDIFGDHSSWIYNCMATGENCNHNICCMHTWSGSGNNYYSNLLGSCTDCFGCASLKHKKYCILNKQYSKKEYEELVPKIIDHMKKTGEWGNFFPVSMSQFAFNRTLGFENYPLNKEEILARGWKYEEIKDNIPKVDKIIDAKRLPGTIDAVPDDILNWAIKCEESDRPYLIAESELSFYKNHQIPIPHLHPEIRHAKRLKLRNPYILYERHCSECSSKIQTTYNPDRPEKVYCEECYLKEVY